ncbi:MAG: hypothetical protein M0R75_11250 [Dehalococcoidia bacterium]|nr:hypothetical protein [Dehalococcoidia bacterium]
MYFFTCEHGSKVLFEELGPPWPLHTCRVLRMQALRREFQEHLADGTIKIRFARDYTKRVVASEARDRVQKPAPREIQRMDPYEGLRMTEVGVVRERQIDVDLFARLDLPETTVSRAIVGDLALGPVTQITLHTRAVGDEDDLSFTFLAPAAVARDAEYGGVVSVELGGRVIGDVSFWQGLSIDSLT